MVKSISEWDVLLFCFFIDFVQVNVGVAFFLARFASFKIFVFASIGSFFLLFSFLPRTNLRWLEFR